MHTKINPSTGFTSSKRLVLILTGVIFMAGFTTLLYEITWFRMMSLLLGATTKASVVVLAGFMAGLGIGAGYWGNKTSRKKSLGLMLAGLFLTTATSNLILYFLLKPVILQLYAIPFAINTGLLNSLVVVVALILMAIPAFFTGGILPVGSALLKNSPLPDNKIIGKLYTAETIGSVAGGLLTGFIFLGLLGQQLTFILAVAINLTMALILYILVKDKITPPSITAKKVAPTATKNVSSINTSLLLAATFIFGFSVMALQILWIRIFKTYLTNTSYSFALISSVVILGLFAGSAIFLRTYKPTFNGPRILFRTLLFTAVATLIGLLVLLRLPQMVIFPLASESAAYFSRIITLPLVASALVILPVTLLSGFAFPLICTLYNQNQAQIGQSVGKVMFWNTIGSVAGPIVAAFVLIPLAGQAWSLVMVGSTLTIMAWLLRGQGEPSTKSTNQRINSTRKLTVSKLHYLMPALAFAGIVLTLFSPQIKILPPSFSRFDKQVLAYHETSEGTYIVARETGNNAALSTYVNNSAVIGSSYDAIKVVKMVGHLPFFAGLKGDKALVIGFGIGVTTSAIASHTEIKRIDCVELVEGLREVAHYYKGLNADIQHDPRVNMIGGDGRQFLLTTGEKYNLISSDPTHPVLGSGNLYTRDYFELCKQRLAPGGMVSQYLPLHKLRQEDFLGIIRTFHSVFPDATVWLGLNHAVLLSGAGHIDFQEWSKRIASLNKDPYFYSNPYHLAANLIFDSTQIAGFPDNIRINTDNRSYTEFFKMSAFDENNLPNNLNFVNKHRADVFRVFNHVPDSAVMQRFILGNRLLTEGIYANLSGDRARFRQKLLEAIKANPGNEELPFLLRFHFQ